MSKTVSGQSSFAGILHVPTLKDATQYTDGYTVGTNPSTKGGWVVYNGRTGEYSEHTISKEKVTNNETELRGVVEAINIAHEGDVIATDSMNTINWLKSGNPKARPDLKDLCQTYKEKIRQKRLTIIWCPREENIAGIYIEERNFEHS